MARLTKVTGLPGAMNSASLYLSALLFSGAIADDALAASPKANEARLKDVFAEICKAGIIYPEIAMSQVQLETGYLTAPMLMARNNLFGFRAKQYLTFPRWQDSVAYYKRWQDKNYKDRKEDYFHFLIRIRYGSGNYKAHVNRFKWTGGPCPKSAD